MRIAVIDYGSGNLRSAAKALERVCASGMKVHITANPDDLERATHIVLPGVGAYGDCMRGLNSISGMLDALEKEVHDKRKPFLGICVGMQLLFERGYEHGAHSGLGWLKGEVVALNQHPATSNHQLKIPHMGWNELAITKHPLLAGIENGAHAYFVHSYHAQGVEDIIATTDYGQTITAVVAKGNMMGTQFHPEKSQETGLMLLRNFVNMPCLLA